MTFHCYRTPQEPRKSQRNIKTCRLNEFQEAFYTKCINPPTNKMTGNIPILITGKVSTPFPHFNDYMVKAQS